MGAAASLPTDAGLSAETVKALEGLPEAAQKELTELASKVRALEEPVPRLHR